MHNKTLKDIFEDKYSELPELLENNGITTLALLNKKVFNENEMYFFEILGYDKKDNERNMKQNINKKHKHKNTHTHKRKRQNNKHTKEQTS